MIERWNEEKKVMNNINVKIKAHNVNFIDSSIYEIRREMGKAFHTKLTRFVRVKEGMNGSSISLIWLTALTHAHSTI
jgi:hypothetical protein